MKTIEFRVRPVTRYNLTRYEDDPQTRSGSIESLGEFDSVEAAERVGLAMHKTEPYSTFATIDRGGQIGGPKHDPFSLGAQMRNEALFAKIGDPS